MRPYGESGAGRVCPCCKVRRGGKGGHERTAERMRSEREAMHELSDYAEQKELDAWRDKCESAHLLELGHLVFTSHGQRQAIAQDIAIRRLRDEGVEP